jgi:hypothetical protein
MDPLDAIPEHLHRSTCILGFLLAKPVPVKRPRDLDDKIRLFDMVQSDHHNISLRSFPTAGELLRANVSTEVRSPKFSLLANYKAELKSKVFALDLYHIHQVFGNLKLAGVQWPECLSRE